MRNSILRSSRHLGVARPHAILECDGATHGIDHARKFREKPITCRFHKSAAVLGNAGVNQFGPVCGEGGERTFLVRAHQPGVSSNVCSQDCRKPSPDTLLGQGMSPCHEWERQLMVAGDVCPLAAVSLMCSVARWYSRRREVIE